MKRIFIIIIAILLLFSIMKQNNPKFDRTFKHSKFQAFIFYRCINHTHILSCMSLGILYVRILNQSSFLFVTHLHTKKNEPTPTNRIFPNNKAENP